jgi:DNA-binding XRE family transcriptional regulator
MRHLTRGTAALVVVALALFAGACNKVPAEAALKAVDQALEAAKPELQKYVPGEFAALADAAKGAHAQFEKGSYTEALKVAQGLPAKIQAAVEAADKKKDELTATWNQLSGSLPTMVDAIKAKVTELAGPKKLPKGIDKAEVETAQSDLGTITQAWTEATAAFQGGDIPKAVQTAQDVKAKAEALASLIGLSPAPTSAAAVKSAPAPAPAAGEPR